MKKRLPIVLVFLAVIIIVVYSGLTFFLDRSTWIQRSTEVSAYPQYQLPRGTLRIGTSTIAVFISSTPDARQRGLSGLPELNKDMGMLFLFEHDAYYPFWMPNMHFPIDIVWIGRDWRVVDIAHAVTPESYPKLFWPKEPARYVLEINAHKASEWGISVGTIVAPTHTES